MPSLYWTKYDELQFAARHILENFDTIKFYTGNINEIAIIKKKYCLNLFFF